MTAGELMRRGFETAHPDTRLELAARVVPPKSGPLLVCEHGRLIGVLDPVELAETVVEGGARARRLRLRDVVPRDVLYCLETTDVEEAAALMREHRVGWIPVLAGDLHPVGLLALADVPGAVAPVREPAHAQRGDQGA